MMEDQAKKFSPSEWNGIVFASTEYRTCSLNELLAELREEIIKWEQSEVDEEFPPWKLCGLAYGVFIQCSGNTDSAKAAGSRLRGKGFEGHGASLLKEVLDVIFGFANPSNETLALVFRMAAHQRVMPGAFVEWISSFGNVHKALRVYRHIVLCELNVHYWKCRLEAVSELWAAPNMLITRR